MPKRIQQAVLAIGAVAALAAGGSAIASAQNNPVQAPASVTQSAAAPEPAGGPDTDNIQSGDQSTPDTGTAATEAPGTEQSAASEASGAAEQPGSESAVNDDGPGGHADEPGNPAADHQFQGVE
jgi:hypothetical protein